jgi:hypothetical protein
MRKQDIERVVALAALWAEQQKAKPVDGAAAGADLPDACSQAPPSSGNLDEVIEAYSAAFNIAFERKDWQSYANISLAVCRCYLQARQIGHAIRHAEGALAVLAVASLSSGDKVRVESPELLLSLGVYLAIDDKPDRARAVLALAREAFEARCDHFHLGQVFDTLAKLAKRAGDVAAMRRCVGCAMEHKQMARDFSGIAATMMILDEKDRFQPSAGSVS